MGNYYHFKALLLATAIWLPAIGMAQQVANVTMPDTKERPSVVITAIETSPSVDGEVINDPLWQSIAPLSVLTQTQPNSGQPASEKTEIRITYDANTFYLSVVCYDSNPEQLVVSDARRDADLDNTDAFLFIIDTYHDKQNGFVFGTNSIGVEYDAQVDNEGQGNFNANRQQGGMIGGFNLNWDGSWEVKTQVGDFGWSAEFAIPLKTIRFKSGEDLTWGANFRRNIRKTNEIAYWAPMPIEFDLKRLSLAGSMSGMNLPSPGNLKIIPYVLGTVQKDNEATDPNTEYIGEFGGEIKYSITPSLTLDLTYNTDFAQVEVDEQQVNLDRFNLFFPEKRPFFLENAGLFSVGSPGEVDLFFSRRIGIGDDGQVVPIIGGARLSGKVKNTNLAFLTMFTEEMKDENIEANNFSVARVNQQIAARSTVGASFISRDGMGETTNDYNRTYALDTKIGLGNKAQVLGYYAKTTTPGITANDHSFKLQAQYEWNGLNVNGAYTEVGEGFNPEVGFLLRSNYRKPEFLVLKKVRMNGKFGLLEIRPHVSYRGYWNFNGFNETSFLHIDNHWEWISGMEIHTGINITSQGVTDPFSIWENSEGTDSVVVASGTYPHTEGQVIFMTNASKPIYVSTRSVFGGFFGGTRYSNSVTLGLRAGDKFNSEFSYQRNDVSLEDGDFITQLFSSRLTYSFTPKIYTQALIQYNSVVDTWSANIRLSILRTANNGLFLVYNESRKIGDLLYRGFTIKYSHMFDILN
jgi:hypothetical protein